MGQLEQSIKDLAKEIGFDVVGITTADPFPRDEEAALDVALACDDELAALAALAAACGSRRTTALCRRRW